MIATACIVLIFCVTLLMVGQGVGPFANPPWAQYHLSFNNLPPIIKRSLNLLSIVLALICSAVLIGFIK